VKPASGSRVCCPYCYEEISQLPAWFRCSGWMSRDSRRCEPEVDDVLRIRTGFGGALPPAFAAGGRPPAANCPECGTETTTKICPVCHSRLPVHFGSVGNRLIALVGPKETGKTVFLTVLVHELMNQTGRLLNASISGADEDTSERFAEDYEQPLYGNSRLLAPTTTAAGVRNRIPLVFRFTTGGHGPRGLNGRLAQVGPFGPFGRKAQHTLLSFFDTAGEDLRSKQSVEQNARYLAAADGVVLLLDPLQMKGTQGLIAPSTRMPTPGTIADQPAQVLENITDLILTGEKTRPNERISKPLAITFSKIDTLFHELRQTSPLLRPPAQTSYFDEGESLAVHAEIQRLLSRWDGPRIDQFAQLNYRQYRYFAVSALGETPTEDNRVSARGIRPYQVASPFLWILAQLGAFPVRRS
jgi:hypothetical protein